MVGAVVVKQSLPVVAPGLRRELARRLDAQLVVLPGIGHQISWTAPDAVLSAIVERTR